MKSVTSLRLLALFLLFPGLLAAAPQSVPERASLSTDAYDFIAAKMAAEEGDTSKALSLMDRLLEKNPDDPILLYERALILLDASKGERAESELRRLVEKQPAFFDAQRLLGRLILDRAAGDRKMMEDALTHLRAAFQLAPDDLSTGMMIVQLLVTLERPAEAEKIIAHLVERVPDNRAVNYHYAQILTRLERGAEARPYLERVIVSDPSFGPAVFQLLDLYQKDQEWKKAADLLQPLIDEDPNRIDLKRQQAFFYLRGRESQKAKRLFKEAIAAEPDDERSYYFLAEALSDLQEFPEADQIYRKLLEKRPNDADLLISYGLSQIAQRRYDTARSTFEKLLSNEGLPDNLVTLGKTQLALIDYQGGDHPAALQRARSALVGSKQPNLQALSIALDVLRKQKQYDEGLKLIEPLLEIGGDNVYLKARYIEFLLRTGQKEKAAKIAEAQIKSGKREALGVAEAFAQNQQYSDAISLLQKLSQEYAQDAEILFQLGAVYERAAKHDQAEKAFLALLELQPTHAPTLNYLGYMWADRGVNLDRAATMLSEAVKQEPRNGAYIDSLGWVFFRLGKLELAEQHLVDASQLLPRDPTVQEHLGDLFAKLGNFDRALEKYRQALTLEPEAKEEAGLRVKIAELEKQTAAIR